MITQFSRVFGGHLYVIHSSKLHLRSLLSIAASTTVEQDTGDGVLAFSLPRVLGAGWRWQVGQKLSDPIEIEFPSLAEASAAQWGSLKDRWGPPPKPFVVAQRG